MASALNAVPMNTSAAPAKAVALACEICTPRELAEQWAARALLVLWHMHGARAHHAAGRRVQAVARVKAGLLADDGARALAAELDRRAAK